MPEVSATGYSRQFGESWETVTLLNKRGTPFNILTVRKGRRTSSDVPSGRELRVLCKHPRHDERVEMKPEVSE